MSELRKIRTFEKKISQFELSRSSGVHPSRISLLENDRAVPSANETERIAAALGMLPEEVFGPDEAMRRLTGSRKKETK